MSPRRQIDVLDALGRLLHGETVREVALRYGVQQTSLRHAIRRARLAARQTGSSATDLEAEALALVPAWANEATSEAPRERIPAPTGASRLTATT